jgi:hypothetical protein
MDYLFIYHILLLITKLFDTSLFLLFYFCKPVKKLGNTKSILHISHPAKNDKYFQKILVHKQTIYTVNGYSQQDCTMKIELDDAKCIAETAITIKGSRRRITVPSEIVEIMNLKDGDKVRWVALKDGQVSLHNIKH